MHRKIYTTEELIAYMEDMRHTMRVVYGRMIREGKMKRTAANDKVERIEQIISHLRNNLSRQVG